jgi:hypothetical protein
MSAQGFAFERRIGYILNQLKESLEGWIFLVHDEQGIREFFKEQSLNGSKSRIPVGISTSFSSRRNGNS